MVWLYTWETGTGAGGGVSVSVERKVGKDGDVEKAVAEVWDCQTGG